MCLHRVYGTTTTFPSLVITGTERISSSGPGTVARAGTGVSLRFGTASSNNHGSSTTSDETQESTGAQISQVYPQLDNSTRSTGFQSTTFPPLPTASGTTAAQPSVTDAFVNPSLPVTTLIMSGQTEVYSKQFYFDLPDLSTVATVITIYLSIGASGFTAIATGSVIVGPGGAWWKFGGGGGGVGGVGGVGGGGGLCIWVSKQV